MLNKAYEEAEAEDAQNKQQVAVGMKTIANY